MTMMTAALNRARNPGNDNKLFFTWHVLQDDNDDDAYTGVQNLDYWASLTFPPNYTAVILQSLHGAPNATKVPDTDSNCVILLAY